MKSSILSLSTIIIVIIIVCAFLLIFYQGRRFNRDKCLNYCNNNYSNQIPQEQIYNPYIQYPFQTNHYPLLTNQNIQPLNQSQLQTNHSTNIKTDIFNNKKIGFLQSLNIDSNKNPGGKIPLFESTNNFLNGIDQLYFIQLTKNNKIPLTYTNINGIRIDVNKSRINTLKSGDIITGIQTKFNTNDEYVVVLESPKIPDIKSNIPNIKSNIEINDEDFDFIIDNLSVEDNDNFPINKMKSPFFEYDNDFKSTGNEKRKIVMVPSNFDLLSKKNRNYKNYDDNKEYENESKVRNKSLNRDNYVDEYEEDDERK